MSVISGVQTNAYNVSNPTFPSLIVLGHDEVDYGNLAFGRRDTEWNLIVRGYVSQNIDQAGQQRLDAWLAPNGAESVRTALEADQTLGGLADWVQVIRATGTNIFQLPNQISALGTDWTVQVQTPD